MKLVSYLKVALATFVAIGSLWLLQTPQAARADCVIPTVACYVQLTAGSSSAPQYAITTAGTGVGATNYAPTALATSTPAQIGSGALTLYALDVSWSSSISTTTTCVVEFFDSATTPTLGTSPAGMLVITTSAAGSAAFPIPPTVGVKIANGLWYGAATTLTGSTACNTVSNALFVHAVYK